MPITEQIKYTNEKFGGKKDLLLLDNNVLASKQYNHIIDEIKEAVLETYDLVKPLFEEYYEKKRGKKRYVDFNQGIDSRLISESNMKKMFEIPVRPVRIAFDHWKLHDIYEKSIRIAVKEGHT